MPETDGPTCTTCLTLNPVGAPACIRCNQPLPEWTPPARPFTTGPATGTGPADWPGRVPPADPAPGQPAQPAPAQPAPAQPAPGRPVPGQPAAGGAATDWPGGPAAGPGGPATGPAGGADQHAAGEYAPPTPVPSGLAVPPRGTPGGSRTAAAAVQPPGYGLGTAAEPADPAGPSPVQQRRISRRIAIVGGIVVLLVLGVGGGALWLTRPRYLDTDAVAGRIGAQLTQRLREPIVVRCPGSARRRAGETFRCTASNGAGITQSVQVRVLDTAGRYEWTLG